jgi:hypothetical protein
LLIGSGYDDTHFPRADPLIYTNVSDVNSISSLRGGISRRRERAANRDDGWIRAQKTRE